jgi:hypothetical protein
VDAAEDPGEQKFEHTIAIKWPGWGGPHALRYPGLYDINEDDP